MNIINEEVSKFDLNKRLQRNMFDSTNQNHNSIKFSVHFNDQYEIFFLFFSRREFFFTNSNVTKRFKKKSSNVYSRENKTNKNQYFFHYTLNYFDR